MLFEKLAKVVSKPAGAALVIGLDILALGLLAYLGGVPLFLMGLAPSVGFVYWLHRAD